MSQEARHEPSSTCLPAQVALHIYDTIYNSPLRQSLHKRLIDVVRSRLALLPDLLPIEILFHDVIVTDEQLEGLRNTEGVCSARRVEKGM